ncbi:LOW QUALITY PROTEIN: hypothetical protein OSB04_un001127 [Centaurea solstitialis]|uniref:Protein FAR1-RELATED SEQUENCE n=1 Tax=Centaurea solstitialis TaxID=347529 RepID=A0AA38SP75_9ASTR|nr:LOW QUALITY PROTEIN: hypothetical protein OSB04_un001127 [Centaurea solstitialis]
MSNEEDHQIILNDVVQDNQGDLGAKRSDDLKSISNDDYDGEHSNQDNALTEESDNNDVTSPNQSRTWMPDVGYVFKPIVGTRFGNLKDAFETYKKYSSAAGFDIRKSTQRKDRFGNVERKFFVCSKEGRKKGRSYNTLEGTSKKHKRRRAEFQSSCPACIKLHVVNENCYEVYKFVEEHNHCLVLPEDKHFLHSNRKMTNSQEYFTFGRKHWSGYNLVKEMTGSYDKVGATKTDFKNFSRDVSSFIGNKDAQMIVDKFTLKKDTMSNFSFEYLVGKKGELTGCFWADETCKLNYKAFGDVVSFDATYKKNKYNMVFVPFTRIDNHQKCVIFGASLLSEEKKEPYMWLLNAFISVHGSEPQMVITDQDLAMKAAI